jgi:Na+:H+ antiporter, NhaA family
MRVSWLEVVKGAALALQDSDGRAAIPPVSPVWSAMTDPPRIPPVHSPTPEAWEPLLRLARVATRPLERFLKVQAASGVLLLLATALALLLANSPLSSSYDALWHTPIGIRGGGFSFERSLGWVVNDGLMVVFFFVVGMEIRREIHCGELSEWRRAALPAAAALGGMLAPAAFYLLIAGAPATRSGWGVPMATDIAFAVGILALLGKRVPAALRVLLLALAVIDDLGAIVVIAIFYSSGIAPIGLLLAALGLAGIVLMQRLGVRTKIFYVLPALVAWAGVYAAGIHPTIAGVIVGMMTPVRAPEVAESLRHVDVARREAMSPVESLIETLHPWVAFGIMPIFALANAGVTVETSAIDAASWHVVVGAFLGLLLGKPIGVLLATWVALRFRVATLPAGITLRHLVVLGVIAGVGFTMALFIAQLAFTDPRLLAAAKLGVLSASGCAAVIGLALGRALLVTKPVKGAALTADEAERSTEA